MSLLKDANQVSYYYKKNNPVKMKTLNLEDGTPVVFFNRRISGHLGYRVSKFGYRRFDTTPDFKAVIIYHDLELVDKKNEIYDIPQSEKKDIIRLLGHLPKMLEVFRSGEEIVSPYDKSLIYVPPSSTREILVGTMLNHKFLYESKSYLRKEFDYNSLEDYYE